jgi:hypothetical protein
VERVLIYLAVVAAVSMALAALFSARPHSLAREACADVRALARDVQVASATRAVVRGNYHLGYPVVVNATGVYCRECLVELSTPTQNSTVLIGRQRLVIDASSGSVVLKRLP